MTPAVVLDKPIVPAEQNTPAVTLGGPVAILDHPLPLGADATSRARPAMIDPQFQRTAFSRPQEPDPALVIRGQGPDDANPKPMPIGPSTDTSNRLFTWQAPLDPEPIHPPRSSTPLPGDVPSGVIVSNPHLGQPVFPDAMNYSLDACTCQSCKPVDGCGCGCACYPGNRFYASAEYLGWWTKASRLPPLLTTSNGADPTDPVRTGALGLPNTQVVYGNNNVAGDFRSGVRLMTGYWFDDERLLGFEVGGFYLQTLTNSFSTGSGGSPGLYRPFLDPGGVQQVEFVAVTGIPAQAFGGTLSGTFSSISKSTMWGAEANLRSCLLCGEDFFIDGIAGFKTLNLNESLTINENPTAISDVLGPGTAGSSFPVQDRFKTNNQFYGGQLGLIGEIRRGPWSLDLKAKLGIGTTAQTVDITGFQLVRSPTGAVTTSLPSGLYAAGTNLGQFTHNAFSVAPEVGLSLGYQVTDHMRAFIGYDFLYWSDVVRPANQIDPVVNRNIVLIGGPGGGPVRPAFLGFRAEDFWAQGIKAGIEFRY